jgi:SAM-dependent methyltransferase
MPGASCLRRAASVSVFSLLLAVTALTAWNFPRTTDPVAARTVADADYRAFYERSYSAHPAVAETCRAGTGRSCEARPEEAPDAERSLVADQVRAFVKAYRLEEKRILDVGSGSGELQDMVRDYTGLDISAAAARFYHKPFVQGSATEMPFPDNSFDAIWTIYVLEHVPQPEKAL